MSNVKIQGNSSGTGTLTIAAPNTNSDFTLNLPAFSGTIPTLASVTNNGVAYVNASGQTTSGSALTFDGSNLGLGVTPSAYTAGKAMEFAFAGNAMWGTGAGDFSMLANVRFNGALQYANTGVGANRFVATGGAYQWYTAPSGTAGNAITFTQAMTLDASGNLGVGTTSPGGRLELLQTSVATPSLRLRYNSTSYYFDASMDANGNTVFMVPAANGVTSGNFVFGAGGSERARIDSSGNLLVGTTTNPVGAGNTVSGIVLRGAGIGYFSANTDYALSVARNSDDGELVRFYQGGTQEGSISVSGTTVSYNGGHLARFAQTAVPKDETLLKGTVLSNLDEMNQYVDADGNPVANEQLNKVKVSDIEGDANVAGVFVNWTHDDAHNMDEINMAMTGDMIIRIAQGTTVQRGDLLMSAGDGTAKPQGDDIVRSKTIAKVTSTYVTCTYADGSFCVPCVLMAC